MNQTLLMWKCLNVFNRKWSCRTALALRSCWPLAPTGETASCCAHLDAPNLIQLVSEIIRFSFCFFPLVDLTRLEWRFLSSCRSLMASTHVNHNIYITEVKTGKCLHSLVGHRRTPWCVTFHPTIPGLVASGCLDGEVRIWDLHVSTPPLHQVHGAAQLISFRKHDSILSILLIKNWAF